MFLCFYKYILIIFNFNSFLFTNNLNKEECNNEKSYYDIIQTMTIQHKNLKKQINQEITILINKITPIIKKYNIPLEDNQSLIYEISQVKKIFMGPNFYELLIH